MSEDPTKHLGQFGLTDKDEIKRVTEIMSKEDPNVILVTVRAKRIEHCTLSELQMDTPILEDEKGIKYKQLIDEVEPVKEITLSRAERRKKK